MLDRCEKLVLNKPVIVIAYYCQNFAKLREQDGITEDIIKLSLCPTFNRTNVFKAGEASGASGSFFFFSHNKEFVVKTMTSAEKHFFVDRFALPYFEHLKQNPNSLLARIYGIYTVKIKGHD